MTKRANPPGLPLPAGWHKLARIAILQAISLAQFALAYTRGWTVNCQVTRVRWQVEHNRLSQEVTLLTEEIDPRRCSTAV